MSSTFFPPFCASFSSHSTLGVGIGLDLSVQWPGYGLDEEGIVVRFPSNYPKRPDRCWSSPIFLLRGIWFLSLGVNRSECKAKHLPTSSTEVKHSSVYHLTPPTFHNVNRDLIFINRAWVTCPITAQQDFILSKNNLLKTKVPSLISGNYLHIGKHPASFDHTVSNAHWPEG